MADYTFDRLYDWLKSEPRSLSWGMISVMDRQKLNLLLLQDYIHRFDTNGYLPAITGSIPNGNNQRFALSRFILDTPRLSFAGKQSNDSRARLLMQVISGTLLNLRQSGNDWDIQEIRHLGPLQGLSLSLDLLLERVAGTVGEDAQLRLDLKESADFSMNLPGGSDAQRLVGEYFRQKFSAWPDADRVFLLGQIEPSRSPFLRAKSFQLRTQARQRTETDEEGAILAMVRFDGDAEGHAPGSDYRYLIPNDRAYDAAVLLAPQRLMLSQLADCMSRVLCAYRFEPSYDKEGQLTGAKVMNGDLYIPAQTRTHEFDTEPDRFGGVVHMILTYRVHPMRLDVGRECTLSVDGKVAQVRWEIRGVMAVEPLNLDSRDGRLGEALQGPAFDTSDFYKVSEDDFIYVFGCTYELEDVQGGRMKCVSADMLELKAPKPQMGEIKVVPLADLSDYQKLLVALLSLSLLPLVMAVVSAIQSIIKAVGETDYPSIESILRDEFERNFQISTPMAGLVNETIKLNFGNVLTGQDQYAPDDMAFFGNVNPAVTGFAISPMEQVTQAGLWIQLPTVPDHSGRLRWTCEPVLPSEDSGPIGSIDENTGRYTPPTAACMAGDFIRVRLRAVHKTLSSSSSALVTVVKSALQLNPLLHVTQLNGTVNLQAGYLWPFNWLEWSSPRYGKLSTQGMTALYTAPAVLPIVEGGAPDDLASFIVERIEVRIPGIPDRKVEALVITVNAIKPVMKIVRQLNAAAGTVALTAMINGRPQDPGCIHWAVVHGSGVVNPSTGVYTHDASSSDRFALITATYDTQSMGTYQGYVVQTLPPTELEDAVQGTGVFAVGPDQAGVA